MNNFRYYLQAFRLAFHILKHMPPKDGYYHAVSFNIKLRGKKLAKPNQ